MSFPLCGNAQIAKGKDKFLGNVYSSTQKINFEVYWNQVTPENAGKWGSVEASRNKMDWSELDAAYKLAKDNNFLFKLHVLIWGNQQPSWIENLPREEQLKEIKEWFRAVSERYPNIDIVEVVNEPLNDPPSKPGDGGGNYINALGGNGISGWDWIVNSFRMARGFFPNSKLAINDYNIIGSTENTNRYLKIIKLLQKDSLIDMIGFQAHAFSTTGPTATMKTNLDLLAATNLPIIITEMDVDGYMNDWQQMYKYQRLFPIFWEHPSVKGITLWGWRNGMWRSGQGAYLLYKDTENPKPAMIWLENYIKGTWIPIESVTIKSENSANKIEDDKGTMQLRATIKPDNATIKTLTWSVDKNSLATIDENGLLTAKENGKVTVTAKTYDSENKKFATFEVTITNQHVTAVDDLEKSANFKIYPNPISDGKFTINGDFAGYKTLSIFNLNGQAIFHENIEEADNINVRLDNYRAGIYIIRISGHDFKVDYRQRIILK